MSIISELISSQRSTVLVCQVSQNSYRVNVQLLLYANYLRTHIESTFNCSCTLTPELYNQRTLIVKNIDFNPITNIKVGIYFQQLPNITNICQFPSFIKVQKLFFCFRRLIQYLLWSGHILEYEIAIFDIKHPAEFNRLLIQYSLNTLTC